MVTGLRVVSGVPKGECELQRALTAGINLCEADIDDDNILGRHICETIRGVFIVARDIVKFSDTKRAWWFEVLNSCGAGSDRCG